MYSQMHQPNDLLNSPYCMKSNKIFMTGLSSTVKEI